MLIIDMFLDPNNLPFTVALVVALSIGILELISLLLGGITDWFDTIIPEKEIGDISGFSVMDYLCIGKIPFLMWLVVFLTSYGLCGLIFQSILNLHVLLAGFIVLFISIFPTRYISLILQKVIPQDETTALYSESFIGSVATIVVGEARKNFPAQAKFKDIHNQTQYVMVVPLLDDEIHVTGEQVILYELLGSNTFKAIKKES